METDNITLAPQSEVFSDLYTLWQEDNIGSMNKFYQFIATPSAARELWLSRHGL